MKGKAKGKGAAIAAVVVILAVAAIRLLGYGSVRSAVRVGCVERSDRHSWSASYILLDGSMKKTVYPGGDTLTVSAQTESGTLSIEVEDAAGEVIFSQAELGTQTLQVPVSGRVTVIVRADRHKGGFEISS